MRATRNFSGRADAGTKQFKGRMPAYARDLLSKRQEGKRIGLLLVAVDDWEGGWYLYGKPNVCRVICPPDFEFSGADFSVASGVDCLVCGDGAPDRLNAATLACLAAGAASVWGEFNHGLWRTTYWPHWSPHVLCEDGPVPFEAFAARLASFRETAILMESGFYGQPMFRPVRADLLTRFGLMEAA